MSHTNSTTNYALPQFLSSDKPAWMADINVAMSDIDAQMKLNEDSASAANTDNGTLSLNFASGYSNLSTYDVGDVVVYNKRMYVCDIAVTVPEAFDNAKWSYYRVSDTADAVANVTAAENALETLVGNTDISAIGDGTVTGAIDMLNANLTNLFKIVNNSTTVTIAGDTKTTVSVPVPSETGYHAILAVYGTSGSGNFLPYGTSVKLSSTDTVANFGVYNVSSNTATDVSVTARFVMVRNGVIA